MLVRQLLEGSFVSRSPRELRAPWENAKIKLTVVAAAKSKERGDISQSFSCPMQFPFIVQNIQVYFWMMTRYFPLFVKKKEGSHLKRGQKEGNIGQMPS